MLAITLQPASSKRRCGALCAVTLRSVKLQSGPRLATTGLAGDSCISQPRDASGRLLRRDHGTNLSRLNLTIGFCGMVAPAGISYQGTIFPPLFIFDIASCLCIEQLLGGFGGATCIAFIPTVKGYEASSTM